MGQHGIQTMHSEVGQQQLVFYAHRKESRQVAAPLSRSVIVEQ